MFSAASECMAWPTRTALGSSVRGPLITAYVVVQETGEWSDIFGSDPQGYIIVAPGGRMMALMTASGRTRASSEADTTALYKSMMAYTGKVSVDGEKFVTTVDMAWDPSWLGTEQTRYYSLDGDKLRIRTAPHDHPSYPGRKILGHLEWKREA
jgi:hypothetical protein